MAVMSGTHWLMVSGAAQAGESAQSSLPCWTLQLTTAGACSACVYGLGSDAEATTAHALGLAVKVAAGEPGERQTVVDNEISLGLHGGRRTWPAAGFAGNPKHGLSLATASNNDAD